VFVKEGDDACLFRFTATHTGIAHLRRVAALSVPSETVLIVWMPEVIREFVQTTRACLELIPLICHSSSL
jgi:hypothetical protein